MLSRLLPLVFHVEEPKSDRLLERRDGGGVDAGALTAKMEIEHLELVEDRIASKAAILATA